jgi:hypothetical protein
MIFGAFTSDGKKVLAASPGPGIVCPDCGPGLYEGDEHFANWTPVPATRIPGVIASPGGMIYSKDSRHAYFLIRETDGTAGIWQIPINGDPERRLVHLSDPSRQFYRTTLDVDDKNFYFTIGDRQSDIWTMELKKQ